MIFAKDARAQTTLYIKHKEALEDLEKLISSASRQGNYKIYGVYINHKKKIELVEILKAHGYKVIEEPIGNNFTIDWSG